MFVRVKKRTPSRSVVQIVASKRVGDKIQQKVLRHVGTARNAKELEALKRLGDTIKAELFRQEKKGAVLFPPEMLQKTFTDARIHREKQRKIPIEDLRAVEETKRVTTGFHDVYGKVYDETGFGKVLAGSTPGQKKLLKETVLARIYRPESKRATSRSLMDHFDVDAPLHKIYRMMDLLDDTAIEKMQNYAYRYTKALIPPPIKVMYFDCTTLYFESTSPNELKQPGFSKDGKHHQDQVILALMVTEAGLPVGYQVFPGSTWEGHSFEPMLNSVHSRFPKAEAVFVADAGMFFEKNLQKIEALGKHYIVGARLGNLPKTLKQQIVKTSDYQSLTENSDLKAKSFEHKGRRLIVTWSAEKAARDAKLREQKLEQLRDKLKKNPSPSSILKSHPLKKFFTVQGNSVVQCNEDSIEEDKKWDGLRGLVTNMHEAPMSEVVGRYKELWQVEYSFRITKNDLRARPIFHYTPSRIAAHLAISFMAYSCVRHLEYRLKVQRGMSLSPAEINRALTSRQYSILKDSNTDKIYGLPSSFSKETRALYRTMGLKLTKTPFLIQ